MLAQVPVPNAFAYGSPLTGSRVAVTPGLLTALNTDEVEAVLGHELGHLSHKDVQVMMAVSALPSVFMYLATHLCGQEWLLEEAGEVAAATATAQSSASA